MSRQRRAMVFHKMQSLGNDFMVIERITQNIEITAEQIAAWADRHTGIGFDQLLIIDPPTTGDADFWYRIHNADGSEAEQCGNGTRCVAMLAQHLRLTKKDTLSWQSLAGRLETRVANAQFETTMTVPVLEPAAIPFDSAAGEALHQTEREGVSVWRLDADDETYEITPVSMGNPHAVLFLDNIFDADVDGIGARLTRHPAFPEGANIGFCQVIDQQFIRLRVYERGVDGETRACGSGACAAVVAAICHGHVGPRVKVSLPGGKLRITWPEADAPVTMAGGANLVYRGELQSGVTS